jgi:hypothetical protein
MVLYCKVDDIPTVFYSFAGQPEQTVTFHLAPIDVQVLDKPSADSGGSGGPCYPNGAPAIGTACAIVYSSWMVWWAGDLSAIGDGYPVLEESGGGRLPDPTTATYDAGYRDEDDGWRYTWSYRLTNITETDEDGTRYKLFFVALAGKRFYFNGQPPSEKPSFYETVGEPGIWGLLSDSCGWTGDSNCRMDGASQPPDGKKKVTLKVSYDNKQIWSAEGDPECIYKVACAGCPEGYLKLKADNPKGFCCIPCKEMQAETAQIKALLRKRNG